MKAFLLFLLLAASILCALVAQGLLSPLFALKGAHILLIPVIFTYGALVLPFPALLALAVLTGLLTDLSFFQTVNGKVEIGLGWSIFFYTAIGIMLQGVRKAFLRGAWWLHPPLSAFCTFLFLTLQYLMISFRRENIIFNELVVWQILVPTAIAFLLSPLVEVFFILIERILPNFPRASSSFREY